MDIIDRVRSFGRGAEPLSAEHLAPARARLQAVIAREPSAARKDKWGTRWALPSLVLGGAAAAAVAAVVIVPLSAQSAAAQVLQGAASLSVTATNITVPSGEYLRIESKSTSLVLWDVDMPTPWARFNNGNPRSAEAGLDVLSSRTIYVPANHSGDWIVSDTNREVVGVTGNRSGEAQEDWSRFFAAPPGQTAIYPGGSSLTPDGGKPSYLDNRDVYSEMPRDPRALLNWWRDRSGLEGDDADRWAVSGIAHDLSVNLAPADLRAAMFDALSLIDGAKVLSTNGDTSTLAFPWRLASRSLETRLTIDVERGLITAVSELEFVSGTIFDSPVVLHETTVSTDIVSAVAP